MNVLVSELLPWIIPPLLGGLIGYITNAIAISMLFRPYKEIRIFGVRIPFTPGIIPRQRGELAESIADTVELELLNEETVRKQTEQPEVLANLQAGIGEITSKVFTTPFSQWGGFFSGMLPQSGGAAKGFVFSDTFEHLVSGVLSRASDTLLDTPLSNLEGREGGLAAALNSLLQKLPEEGFIDRTEEALLSWITRQEEKGVKISDFITPEDISALGSLLDGLYTPVFEGLVSFLKKDETLDELEIRGRRFLHDVIDNLTALQRLLITAGQYDRTLDENMDKIVVDLVAHIEKAGKNEETKKNVLTFVQQEIQRLADTGLGGSEEKHTRVKLVIHEILRKLRALLSDGKFRETLSQRVALLFLKEGRTLRSLLGNLPGFEKEKVVAYLSGGIVRLTRNLFSRKGDAEAEEPVGKNLAADLGKESPASLFSLTAEDKVKADHFVTRWITGFINKKIPDILKSMNVHNMVVDRINSFDIVKMEQLILRVVKKHLRWITLFGGLLGAVIGFAQIGVNRFL
ncbi:MAG: DUF445 family protein [Spirochaetales bacterium]|nr:DUF445 family protein [Spirochaetales bacterium]